MVPWEWCALGALYNVLAKKMPNNYPLVAPFTSFQGNELCSLTVNVCSHWPRYSGSDIISNPIIMETIKICRNWHIGSDSDLSVQVLLGTIPILSDQKSKSESESDLVSVNAR